MKSYPITQGINFRCSVPGASFHSNHSACLLAKFASRYVLGATGGAVMRYICILTGCIDW